MSNSPERANLGKLKHPEGGNLCNIKCPKRSVRRSPLPFLGGPKKAIFLHKIPPLPKIFLGSQGTFLVGGVFFANKLPFLDHPEMVGG